MLTLLSFLVRKKSSRSYLVVFMVTPPGLFDTIVMVLSKALRGSQMIPLT